MTHGNHAVGIARISYDQDLCPVSGLFLNGFALSHKNAAIDAQEIVSLHSGFPWCSTNQKNPVCIFKRDACIGSGGDVLKQWKGTVIQFHLDPV